jgi:hypothetical protein
MPSCRDCALNCRLFIDRAPVDLGPTRTRSLIRSPPDTGLAGVAKRHSRSCGLMIGGIPGRLQGIPETQTVWWWPTAAMPETMRSACHAPPIRRRWKSQAKDGFQKIPPLAWMRIKIGFAPSRYSPFPVLEQGAMDRSQNCRSNRARIPRPKNIRSYAYDRSMHLIVRSEFFSAHAVALLPA